MLLPLAMSLRMVFKKLRMFAAWGAVFHTTDEWIAGWPLLIEH